MKIKVNVRAGRVPNPSPPEVGLRMARLWDAIRDSGAGGGSVVRLPAADPVIESSRGGGIPAAAR